MSSSVLTSSAHTYQTRSPAIDRAGPCCWRGSCPVPRSRHTKMSSPPPSGPSLRIPSTHAILLNTLIGPRKRLETERLDSDDFAMASRLPTLLGLVLWESGPSTRRAIWFKWRLDFYWTRRLERNRLSTPLEYCKKHRRQLQGTSNPRSCQYSVNYGHIHNGSHGLMPHHAMRSTTSP